MNAKRGPLLARTLLGVIAPGAAFWVLDALLDTYVFRASRFADQLLRPAGKHVNEMNVDPEFASKVILPAIRQTGSWVGELMVKHKSGRIFPIWLTTSIIRDDRGATVAIVGIIRHRLAHRG